MSRLVALREIRYLPAARVRVIYADTDKMGVVYHATYLRYMEHARVEFIRSLGVTYAEMERMGYGLPVIDLVVSYLSPARYDDLVTVWVGLAKLSAARVHFAYRATVEAGDRHGTDQTVELLRAETFHGCVDLLDGRAARIPDLVHDFLQGHIDAGTHSANGGGS